jgi:ATP-dependent DNA helicase
LSSQDAETRFARLNWLLQKSAVYSSIPKQQMDKKGSSSAVEHCQQTSKQVGASTCSKRFRGRKRLRIGDDDSDDDDSSSKRKKLDNGQSQPQDGGNDEGQPKLRQPALLTGATLKDYQLEGVEWMISLDQNGISGILGKWDSFTLPMSSHVPGNVLILPFFQRMKWAWAR